MNKVVILWLSDGVKWGFDIRAKTLAKLLPNYDHRILPCAYMKRDGVAEVIKTANVDIIMAMNPVMLEFLKDRSSKIIVTLPSYRCLEDWHRWNRGDPAPDAYRKVYSECRQEEK